MKALYFDCFAGISGDMIVGAFLDAGLDFGFFEAELKKLHLTGYEISSEKTKKNEISGTKFIVTVKNDVADRSFSDIDQLIEKSGLDSNIRKHSRNIFKRLAEVESGIHGVAIEDVHFHEIGAVDSIIDIVKDL